MHYFDFHYSWEQRKFDDITYPAGEKNRDNLPYESYSVTNENGFIPQNEQFENGGTMATADKSMYYIVSKNSFAYNPARINVGSIGYYDKPENVIVSSLYEVFKTSEDIDDRFLWHWFKSDAFQRMIEQYQEGGVRLYFYYDKLCMCSLPVPDIQEQRKIGKQLDILDNLITLHQRKCQIDGCRFQSPLAITWEQRKVGDLLIERNQQAPMSDEYPLMAFIANEGVAPKGDRYDRSALVTDTANKLYKKTEIGDFIYSSNNLETGSIGLNKYGKACISPVYSIFEPTGIADSDFLGRRLVRKDFINAMVKWRQGVIYGQWRIHESDFLKIEIPVPSVVEQRKIGAYLDQLDRLITLHQREFVFLCKEKIEIIRYIKNTWEQRKLSEIATMHARIGWQNLRTSEFLDNGDYMLITGTDFMDGAVNFDTCHYVERERYEQDKHIQIRNGSILITKDGTLGKVAYIQGLTMPATLNAGVFNVEIRDEKEVDNRYLFQYLKAPFLMDYVDKKATGGTIKHLNQNILVDFPVVLPQKDEQAKIGEYFLGIDNLITLHQRKPIVVNSSSTMNALPNQHLYFQVLE